MGLSVITSGGYIQVIWGYNQQYGIYCWILLVSRGNLGDRTRNNIFELVKEPAKKKNTFP